MESDDFEDFFDFHYLDQPPLIAALGSSLGFDWQRDQAALENAAELVLGVEVGDSSLLIDALNTPPPEAPVD